MPSKGKAAPFVPPLSPLGATAPGLSWHWHLPGLDRLLEMLRRQDFAIGASEAVDASRVMAHLAASTPPEKQERARLKAMLAPVLCKSQAQRARFDALFDQWANAPVEGQATVQPELQARASAPASAVAPRAKAGPWAMLAGGLLLVMGLAGWLWGEQAWQWARAKWSRPVGPTPVQSEGSAQMGSTAQPVAPRQASTSASAPNDITPYAYFQPLSQNEEVRQAWLWLALGLPVAGLLPLIWAQAPKARIGRRRGTGTVQLAAWPASKYLRQLVFDLPPAAGGALQRHVRGQPGEPLSYARRPRLDPQRTVQATLARLGWPTVRYLFARLRPSYMVLVHAQEDEDLGVLWAQRLRALDVQVDIFRFAQAADRSWQAQEVGGLGRRLPLQALPSPPAGQRLIVIARMGELVSREGEPHAWVHAAQLTRWAQRALFTPEEPRDWRPVQVDALERQQGADGGMLVLPFEDNALRVWSEWLPKGQSPDELPPVPLAEPQFYPRLLKTHASRFVGDAPDTDLSADPAKVGAIVSQLVTQLQTYLGENGFYWLCACAVPPLLHRRLALLLGEQYFLRCGASEERIRYHMARNWRLMVRLPWLRDESQMPAWLRLALLTRLPESIQDELREVVRGALGQPLVNASAASKPDGSHGEVSLGFESPAVDEALASGLPRPDRRLSPEQAEPAYALFIGFVREEQSASRLALSIPGGWQRWLPGVMPRPSWAQRWRAAWARLWLRQGVSGEGPSRLARGWAVVACTVGVAGLAVLAVFAPQDWPTGARTVLFERVLHQQVSATLWLPLAQGGGGRVVAAFSPDGRQMVRGDNSSSSLRRFDLQSGQELTPPLRGHALPVDVLTYSPDGRYIASGSVGDHTERLWDAQTGQVIGQLLDGQAYSVSSQAFSPDGRYLVSGGGDMRVRLWDVRAARAVGDPWTGHDSAVAAVSFSVDGKRVISGSLDGSLRWWDVASGRTLGVRPGAHPGGVTCVALSPDGRSIASAGRDQAVRLWDAQKLGEPLRTFKMQSDKDRELVAKLAFSHDGHLLVAGDQDGRVYEWDVRSGAPLLVTTLAQRNPVTALAFSPDGLTLLASAGNLVHRLSAKPMAPVTMWGGSPQLGGFSPDGRRVVTWNERTIQVWDVASGTVLARQTQPNGVVYAFFGEDANTVLAIEEDNQGINVWDVSDGRLIRRIAPADPSTSTTGWRAADVSSDGALFAATIDQGGKPRINVWRTRTGALLASLTEIAYQPNELMLSGDGGHVVYLALGTGLEPELSAWDLGSGRRQTLSLRKALGQSAWPKYSGISRDGRYVALRYDRAAFLWNMDIGHLVLHLKDVVDMAFSLDGKRLVSADAAGTIQIFDTESGRELGKPLALEQAARWVSFSPDNTRLVTVMNDGTVRIWRSEDMSLLGVPVQVRGEVTAIAWNPSGTHLAVSTSERRGNPSSVSLPKSSMQLATVFDTAQRLSPGATYLVWAPPADINKLDEVVSLMSWCWQQLQRWSQLQLAGFGAALVLVLLHVRLINAQRDLDSQRDQEMA